MKKTDNRTGGYIALATTSIIWGTTWVSSKIGVSLIPVFELTSLRQGLAGICYLTLFILIKKLPLPTAREFVMLTVLALLMFVVNNGISTWSLRYIPAGLSSLIGALYPISVVLIEMIFFKKRDVSVLTFIGLLLGIGGTVIVFYETAFHHRGPGFFLGIGLSVIAMLSWSVGTMVLAKNKINMNPYYAVGWQMVIGAAIMMGIAVGTGTAIPLSAIPTKAWYAIAYLVIAGSLIAYAAFVYSMKKLPPALFSLYAYFNPLVAMLVSAVLLKEKLTINILWGAIVTLAGVFLVNYSIKRENLDNLHEPDQ